MDDNFRKSRVLSDKLIAMVTPDNLENQNYLFYAQLINIKSHQVSSSSS